MMYGSVETDEERVEHLMRLRALQDETGGFTAFIAWSYQPEHTELGLYEATGVDYLRTLALARIVLDNFDNLQASWVTQGGKVGQLSLAFGANDMGSVMIEENVVRAAGASYCMDEVEIVRNIEDAGFTPKRRNMHYDILGDPIFRLHALGTPGILIRSRGARVRARDGLPFPCCCVAFTPTGCCRLCRRRSHTAR
jgi:cyclic dehypoxanthinyl futalosine synthase